MDDSGELELSEVESALPAAVVKLRSGEQKLISSCSKPRSLVLTLAQKIGAQTWKHVFANRYRIRSHPAGSLWSTVYVSVGGPQWNDVPADHYRICSHPAGYVQYPSISLLAGHNEVVPYQDLDGQARRTYYLYNFNRHPMDTMNRRILIEVTMTILASPGTESEGNLFNASKWN